MIEGWSTINVLFLTSLLLYCSAGMLLFHPKHEELTIESDVINYCQARILSLLSMGDKASWYDIFTVYCQWVEINIY